MSLNFLPVFEFLLLEEEYDACTFLVQYLISLHHSLKKWECATNLVFGNVFDGED